MNEEYHCPYVARHKESGALFDLSPVRGDGKKRFDEIGFDSNWEFAFVPGNMHDSDWWNNTPAELPSEFFNQGS